jgi:glycosyltransferase involved in cell wall biosynthesis
MKKVCVLQTDNRPSLHYLLKTQEVNKKFCDILEYDYLFVEIDNNKYGNIHPATKKIHIVNDFLQNNKYDLLVFLDSDAWIQNGYWLNDIINNLINDTQKQGCFSRDPYIKKATFINSGSFIIKINDFTKQLYKNIINDLYSNEYYHNILPFDQYYISKYIFENKDSFVIFVPDILNTPIGKVLRHNWLKNKQMFDDLEQIMLLKNEDISNNKTVFLETDYYCNKEFPNTKIFGYEYFDINYKYNLSVCLCIKNEAKYIYEFIEHYIKQGVDHFYIVSNNSTDNVENILYYPDLITLIIDNRNMGILENNSSAIGHTTLLNEHFYPLIIKETKWAIFVDADEFMFGKNNYTIKSYLSGIPEEIGCIYVIWNIINPVIVAKGVMSNTFSIKQNVKRLNYDLINNLSGLIKNANDFGKSIVRTSMLSEQHKLSIHKIYSSGVTINNYNVVKNNNYDNCNNIEYSEENYKKINITLNHYAIRNFEDYIKKEKQLVLVTEKQNFINGLFEMLELPNEFLIDDGIQT